MYSKQTQKNRSHTFYLQACSVITLLLWLIQYYLALRGIAIVIEVLQNTSYYKHYLIVLWAVSLKSTGKKSQEQVWYWLCFELWVWDRLWNAGGFCLRKLRQKISKTKPGKCFSTPLFRLGCGCSTSSTRWSLPGVLGTDRCTEAWNGTSSPRNADTAGTEYCCPRNFCCFRKENNRSEWRKPHLSWKIGNVYLKKQGFYAVRPLSVHSAGARRGCSVWSRQCPASLLQLPAVLHCRCFFICGKFYFTAENV